MFKYRHEFIRVTCDKCGKIDDYPPFAYDGCNVNGKSKVFFEELREKGWIITADVLYAQLDDYTKESYPCLSGAFARRIVPTLDFCCEECCREYMKVKTLRNDY